MPNIKSAKKRVSVTEAKSLVNKNNKTEVKSAIKKELETQPSDELQNYIDNFKGIVQTYRNRLTELSKTKTN